MIFNYMDADTLTDTSSWTRLVSIYQFYEIPFNKITLQITRHCTSLSDNRKWVKRRD